MQKKAKRRFEPQREANQFTIDLKKVSLDYIYFKIDQDKRTTLMIKNIPNKYTQ